jgi:hypothetical protein
MVKVFTILKLVYNENIKSYDLRNIFLDWNRNNFFPVLI